MLSLIKMSKGDNQRLMLYHVVKRKHLNKKMSLVDGEKKDENQPRSQEVGLYKETQDIYMGVLS